MEFMNRKVKTQKELRDVLRDADRSAEFQVRVETVSERRRSHDDVGALVGDVGVTPKMESAFTKKSVDLAHQVVKFYVRLGVEDSSLISRWYVVFEREAREFQSYLCFTSSREYQSYHSNHENIIATTHL